MMAHTRGPSTDQYQIQIQWVELLGDETRGAYITSYYLQWDKGTTGAAWYDLCGLTDQYMTLEFTATFGDIVPGSNY